MVNTWSVGWRQELRSECIQSFINPNVESDNDGSDLDIDEAMEINSKLVVNLGEALAMLDNLQLLFEENDAENEVLRSVVSLTKKSRKCASNQRNKKLSLI